MTNEVYNAVSFIRKITPFKPTIGLVLGSGIGTISDDFIQIVKISTIQIPYFAPSTVAGHEGQLLFGFSNNKPLVVSMGRSHYYEGYNSRHTAFYVSVFKELGIRLLILSNAAGAISSRLKPGDLMLINDQVHFMFNSPLRNVIPGMPVTFPDISQAYSKVYLEKIESIAKEENIPLKCGNLWSTSGPAYETAAEVRMLIKMGADAVSMSTTQEVIMSASLGLDTIGISFITNYATGLSNKKLSHAEVIESAETSKNDLLTIIRRIITSACN